MKKREIKRRPKPNRNPKRHPRSFSQRFEVYPDPASPLVVEVRIARNLRQMYGEVKRLDGRSEGNDYMGLCRSWHYKITKKPAIRPRGVVARIYLNAQSLAQKPSEITSHECAHAAMAWARLRRANLNVMPGEEVMCHALGRLVAQVNRVCYAAGAFA